MIVAAVVRRVHTDNSFGGEDVFDRLNIVQRLGDATGDGMVNVGEHSVLIDADTRLAIEQALAPAVVTWVDSTSAVIGDAQQIPDAAEVGAILTIAAPKIDGDRATITTGLWCGGTCGTGGTHTLKRTSGTWNVTGATGPQWVS